MRAVKAVVLKELAEKPLVLKYLYRLIRSLKRKSELFGSVGSRYDSGIAGKGDYTVDIMLLCSLENSFLVDNAYIAVFIRILMGNIIGKVIAGNYIAAKLVSFFDDGYYESRSAENHKFFHIFLSFFRFKRLLKVSMRYSKLSICISFEHIT